MGKRGLRGLSALVVSIAMVASAAIPGAARGIVPGPGDDAPILLNGVESIAPEDEDMQMLLDRDAAFIGARTAGDIPLSVDQAGRLRGNAAKATKAIDTAPTGSSFAGAWTGLGPNPTQQITNGAFQARSGRIGALAIRQNGQWILGAAQGGIWLYDSTINRWVPKTDKLASLAIGALAVAPSNDLVVYAGTGEGALSGDSYFGNGILKSSDGGNTWSQVSGEFLVGVSTTRLAVDPTNANHLYASISRGRGGVRRVSPPVHSTYGIWESTDGAVTWTLRMAAPAGSLGATDIRMDTQNPANLYASFWSDKIYKSTNGGTTWTPIMTGFPANADFAAGSTRFALAVSHPAGQPAVLYAGFDYNDTGGLHHTAKVWRSDNEGAGWAQLPTTTDAGSVSNYCGGQCFYDNVIEADPSDSNIVFAAGQVSSAGGGGAIFRSTDGGQHWKNMSFNQHADFHALAFNPANTANVLIGNDGGVSYSPDRGGRNAGEGVTGNDWQNLNGRGLQITQFTSIATVPQVPAGANSERFWGGTQDNGTQRKSVNSQSWFDVAGGDGGQVLVDQTDTSVCAPLFTQGCYVYGTYFNISPYRITDAGGSFFTNKSIVNGINPNDRTEFYEPFVLNQQNTNQLFIGTQRLYRSDNAKEPVAGDVTWTPISPDLTTGCTGPAPNGARNCTLSAIGVGGGTAVYTGSNDGLVYISSDAQVNLSPTWTRIGVNTFPGRPVASIAVDRSDYRVAYFAFNSFDGATPGRPGHIWKTADGGQTFTDITRNLPDTPVNSIVIDPAFPRTLYIGTDVGPFVTYNGGGRWFSLGTGFPVVAIDQLDLDPYHRLLAAGTHGRGAWRLKDMAAPTPALVISKVDAGVPVGPGSKLDYTLTVRNIGNADSTGVIITDPIPVNTTFVSADQGGQADETVRWTGKSIPAGASISVHFEVEISPSLASSVTSIVNDGFRVADNQGEKVYGSPTVTKIAPPFAVSVSPASQTGGAQSGGSQTYAVTVRNLGYKTDSYNLSSTGGTFPVTFFDSTCTTPMTTTPAMIAGATTGVCVKVSVPTGVADGTASTSTVTATSVGSPTTSASAGIKTIAVTVGTLLVDGDGNGPDVHVFYTTALSDAHVAFDSWDLKVDPNLPVKYMEAFKNIVWFTGNSFPGPIQPYERNLTAYLNNGGNLFLSGHDILDQAAGTTAFAKNYLHVDWDGSETQNDKATTNVHAVATSLTDGIGAVPLDHSVLGFAFEDQITPNDGANKIFTDDAGAADALSFSGAYKVVFLAFPLEAYGTAGQKADLVVRVLTFFGS